MRSFFCLIKFTPETNAAIPKANGRMYCPNIASVVAMPFTTMSPICPGAVTGVSGREAITCSTKYDTSANNAPTHQGSLLVTKIKSSSGLVFCLAIAFPHFQFFVLVTGLRLTRPRRVLPMVGAALLKSFTFITCVVYLNHGFPTFILQ